MPTYKTPDEKMTDYLALNKEVLDARAKVQVAQAQVRLIRSLPAMMQDHSKANSVEAKCKEVTRQLDAELKKLESWDTQKITLQSGFTSHSRINWISLKLSELGEWFNRLIYPKGEVYVDHTAIEGTPEAKADFSFAAGISRVGSFLGRSLKSSNRAEKIVVPRDISHAHELLDGLLTDVTKVVSEATTRMEWARNPTDATAQGTEMTDGAIREKALSVSPASTMDEGQTPTLPGRKRGSDLPGAVRVLPLETTDTADSSATAQSHVPKQGAH